MAYLVLYTPINTDYLVDFAGYFAGYSGDINTQHEFRSHTSELSLDMTGFGLGNFNTGTVQSITLYFGTVIANVGSEHTVAWQITGLSQVGFNTSWTGYQFSATVLSGSDTIVGSNGGDGLSGFAGNDLILGRLGFDQIIGGPGNDRLSGGPGDDNFQFDVGLKAANADTITDFVHGHDNIALDKSIFTRLNLGLNLNPAFFHAGAAAADANDFIVYHRPSGHLYYDKDGSGPAHQALFAILANHAA